MDNTQLGFKGFQNDLLLYKRKVLFETKPVLRCTRVMVFTDDAQGEITQAFFHCLQQTTF